MSQGRITSISSASIDWYPDNTNSKFTHYLPAALELLRGRRYTISLLSLCIPTKLKSISEEPSYINIHLQQLDSKNFTSGSSLRCLSKLVLPKSGNTDNKFYWLDVENPRPLLLDETINILQELSFELRDEQNNLLQFENPTTEDTLLNLIVEEMDQDDDCFTLILNKELSRNLYPDNCDNDFQVKFGHTAISQDDDDDSYWEMALHSVIVPTQICLANSTFECTVKNNETSVKKQIKNTGQTALQLFKELSTLLTPLKVNIIEQVENKWMLHLGKTVKSIHFNTSLCQMFNITEANGLGKGHTEINNPLSQVKSKLLFENLRDEFTLPRPDNIAIYSDMVQSSVIGDARAHLVDIISAKNLGLIDSEKDTLYNVMYPIWRPVHKPSMIEASIKLGDIYGNPINLERDAVNDNNINIQYLFIFRK